jgi:pyrroloquinoline quinone (PQQ) biosynthesis protein C
MVRQTNTLKSTVPEALVVEENGKPTAYGMPEHRKICEKFGITMEHLKPLFVPPSEQTAIPVFIQLIKRSIKHTAVSSAIEQYAYQIFMPENTNITLSGMEHRAAW